jgi:hypothetical protein
MAAKFNGYFKVSLMWYCLMLGDGLLFGVLGLQVKTTNYMELILL